MAKHGDLLQGPGTNICTGRRSESLKREALGSATASAVYCLRLGVNGFSSLCPGFPGGKMGQSRPSSKRWGSVSSSCGAGRCHSLTGEFSKCWFCLAGSSPKFLERAGQVLSTSLRRHRVGRVQRAHFHMQKASL